MPYGEYLFYLFPRVTPKHEAMAPISRQYQSDAMLHDQKIIARGA
jgi:hypothetical protein